MARAFAVAMMIALGATTSPATARPQVAPAPGLDATRPAPPLGGGRSGSAPGLDQRPAAPTINPDIDPSKLYRLIESYGPPEAPGDGIGPYRVAFVETLDQAIEQAGEAPRRTRLAARVVYVARPAIVGGLEGKQVSALVRQYETAQVTRDGRPDPDPDGPTGLAGQTLWVQDEGRPAPTILTLPGSPPLTQEQFGFAAYQQVYLPELSGLLSPLHVGVGMSWMVPPQAAEALVGTQIRSGNLEAQFEDLLPPVEGEEESRAVIRVTGRLELLNSSAGVNARLEFAFRDPSRGNPDDAAQGVDTLDPTRIDATGAVVRVLLALREVIEVPGPDGRIAGRMSQLRELNLERRFDLGGVSVPSLPSPPPSPTPENSWVIYRDPEDRFQFSHPQDYRPVPIEAAEGVTLNLKRQQIGGVPDDLTLVFFPRGEVPPEIRPEPFSRRIVEVWRSIPPPGVTLGRGSEGYLPEGDWPGMRIYRIELPLSYNPQAFRISDVGRAYFSAYLAQLANGAVLSIEALTEREEVAPFREEVEAILRTFTADPDSPPSRPASPSPAPADGASPSPSRSSALPSSSDPVPDRSTPTPGDALPPVETPAETPPIETPLGDPPIDLPPDPTSDPLPGADRPSRPPPPPFE